MKRSRRIWTVLSLAVCLCAVALAQDDGQAVLIHAESSGVLMLDTERTLEIRGAGSTFSVRPGKPGELQYMARTRDNSRSDLPIELWLDDKTLRFVPLSGREDQAMILEVTVSPELTVEFAVDDSKVMASGLGGFELRGSRNEVTARAMRGEVDIELDGGSVRVESAADMVTIEGRNLEVDLGRIEGDVVLALKHSAVRVAEITASVDIDAEQTKVDVRDVRGMMRITAVGGEVDVKESVRGIEANMDEAALTITQARGDIQIETNAEVRLQEIRGKAHVIGFGGTVRALGVTGGIEIQNENASVILENISGPTRVEGSDLQVHLKAMRGESTVRTISSTIQVEDLSGSLDVQNEYGDISVLKASKWVNIVSRDGNVAVSELSGSIAVNADGELVTVDWLSVDNERDSEVKNAGGELRVTLAPQINCLVRAEAEFGHVESGFETIRVSDDGSAATGVLGRASRPRIQLRSGGNLFVTAPKPQAAAPVVAKPPPGQ